MKLNPRHILAIIFFSFLSTLSFSQSGGLATYSFLNLSNSARMAALGSTGLSVRDNDLDLAVFNPSLITPQMDNNLSLSFVNYYAGINYGFAAYSKTFEKYGSFTGAMQYINYGMFTNADATGEIYGNFTAGEYAMIVGWGKSLDSSFSIGANLKNIYSSLYDYHSYGIAVDVTGSYFNKEHNFSSSLIFKNIGRQIVKFRDGESENLPFEIQLSLSKKLEKAPIRFFLVGENLQKYDLTYVEPQYAKPTTDPLTGEPIPERKALKQLDKFFRHIVGGVEFFPSKNICLSLGYNYKRSKELRVPSRVSTVGISWGLALKISKLKFGYARSAYHLAGSPNNITISTNLSDFIKK